MLEILGNHKRPIVKTRRPIAVSSVLIDRGAPGYRTSIMASSKMDVESVASQLARDEVFRSIQDTLLDPASLIAKAEAFLPSKQGVIKTKTTWFTSESIVKDVAEGMKGDPVVKVSLLAQVLIELFGSLGMVSESRTMRIVQYRDSLFPTLPTLLVEMRKMVIAQALDKLKFSIPAAANRSEISVGALASILSPILIDFSNDLNMADKIENEFIDSLYLIRAYLTQDMSIFESSAEKDILNDENLKIMAHNYSLASLAIKQGPNRPRRALPFWEGLLARTKANLSALDRFKWERADVVKNYFSHDTVRDGKGRLSGVIAYKNNKFDGAMQAVYPIKIGRQMTVLNGRAEILGDVISRATTPLGEVASGDFLANQIWSIISNIVGHTGQPMSCSLGMNAEELDHYAATLCTHVSIATVVVDEVEMVDFIYEIDAAGLAYFPSVSQIDAKYITLNAREAILLSAPDGHHGTGVLEPKSSKLPADMMGDIFLHEESDSSIFTDPIDRNLPISIQFRNKRFTTDANLLSAYGLSSLSGTRFVVQQELSKQLASFMEIVRGLYNTPQLSPEWDEQLDLNVSMLRKIIVQIVDNVFGAVHQTHAVRELADTLFHEITANADAKDRAAVRNAIEKSRTNMELRLEATKMMLVRSGLLELKDADFILELYRDGGMMDNYAISTYKVR